MPNQDLLLTILGVLLLFIGIMGGGFEIKEIKIPKVGIVSRVIGVLIGFVLIVVSVEYSRNALDDLLHSPTKWTEPNPKKTYKIMAKHSGMSMTIDNGELVQRKYAGEDSEFNFKERGAMYQIISKKTNDCVEVKAGSKYIILANCKDDSADNQLFELEVDQKDSTHFKIKATRHSEKCLDVMGESEKDKAKIQQHTCKDVPNQLWKISLIND